MRALTGAGLALACACLVALVQFSAASTDEEGFTSLISRPPASLAEVTGSLDRLIREAHNPKSRMQAHALVQTIDEYKTCLKDLPRLSKREALARMSFKIRRHPAERAIRKIRSARRFAAKVRTHAARLERVHRQYIDAHKKAYNIHLKAHNARIELASVRMFLRRYHKRFGRAVRRYGRMQAKVRMLKKKLHEAVGITHTHGGERLSSKHVVQHPKLSSVSSPVKAKPPTVRLRGPGATPAAGKGAAALKARSHEPDISSELSAARQDYARLACGI